MRTSRKETEAAISETKARSHRISISWYGQVTCYFPTLAISDQDSALVGGVKTSDETEVGFLLPLHLVSYLSLCFRTMHTRILRTKIAELV